VPLGTGWLDSDVLIAKCMFITCHALVCVSKGCSPTAAPLWVPSNLSQSRHIVHDYTSEMLAGNF